MKPGEMVTRLLQAQGTLALATTDADGAPHVAPVFYLAGRSGNDALRLYWYSSVRSLHSRNLRLNSAAAVTVCAPTEQWREIRGVQMRGTASVVRDPARRNSIAEAYSARFRLEVEFRAVQARSRLYEFRPSWIRYLDNSIRFGYKIEFRLTARPGR
ncbi:MAG: pyridoxamine 5'-phosphate oxidase family protein [Bryobacteraceae bacterium]